MKILHFWSTNYKTVLATFAVCLLVVSCAYFTQMENIANEKLPKTSVSKPRYRDKTDVVILVTMMRSGSSIVGSIFNERINVTYLYEPLFPFGKQECNEKTRQSSLEVFRNVSSCHFENLALIYQTSTRDDIHARCKKYNYCFADDRKANRYLYNEAKICTKKEKLYCPKPLPATSLNNFCRRSLLVAMKVIYLCKLEWLMPLLGDPDFNIKVVHLVRDPRPTIYSRTKHTGNLSLVRNKTDAVCDRLLTNLIVLEQIDKDSNFWGKYMRVRYEDFVLNPIGLTLKIYKFVGLNMTLRIKDWLDIAFSKTNHYVLAKGSPQSLLRNVKSVMNNWRKDLSFEAVQEIQSKCERILKILDYKIFRNNQDFKDLSTLYFTPN